MFPIRPNSPTTWMFGVSSLATLKPKSTFDMEVEKEFSDVPPNPTADAVRSCARAVTGATHTARRKDRAVRRYDMAVPDRQVLAIANAANQVPGPFSAKVR